MNDIRFQLIRGRAAQVLDAASPNLFAEEELFKLLKPAVPQLLRGEFDYVLGEMETAKQLLRHRGERGIVKCKLTETGEAELL